MSWIISGAWSAYFWNWAIVHRIPINSCIAWSLGLLQTTNVSHILCKTMVLEAQICSLIWILCCRNDEEGLVFSQLLNLSRFPQVSVWFFPHDKTSRKQSMHNIFIYCIFAILLKSLREAQICNCCSLVDAYSFFANTRHQRKYYLVN